MWDKARADIERIFFKDMLKLYSLGFTQNEIGETIEEKTLVGEYPCNVEEGQSSTNSNEAGQTAPQSFRISTLKSIPLTRDLTYKLQITQARITHTDELLIVDGWTEAQLSTVISASREVAV